MKHTMAVIGFGGMGRWHARNVTERIDDIFVKGIFDITEGAKEFAREKGHYSYESLEELLADDEIELVTIA